MGTLELEAFPLGLHPDGPVLQEFQAHGPIMPNPRPWGWEEASFERLGDPRALPQAALARLKAPSPWTLLHHLRQELLFGEAPLEEVAGAVEPYLLHEARGVRILAGYLLLFLRLLEGGRRAAGELLLGLLPQLGPGSYPAFLPEGALALRGRPEGWAFLEGARVYLQGEEKEGVYALALGLFYWPRPQAYPHLERAARFL